MLMKEKLMGSVDNYFIDIRFNGGDIQIDILEDT